MTRKQLTQALRVLHEFDNIEAIKLNYRKRHLQVTYTTTEGRSGELLASFAEPDTSGQTGPTKTK